tara:strand:- start:10291 stop:11634 length:1344 start_codon:yes stop_codon:yes gene_type:complete
MFKIYHFANSFISVKSNNSILTCDPWIGKTNDNGWCSYPIIDTKKINKEIFKSDFVYISHLHCDHLDFKTLAKFKNKKMKFVIKKFPNPTLKNRLKRFFKNKIIEIEPFKEKKLNNELSVAIIPQILGNSDNLEDNIQYDMDTSILIYSKKYNKVFYNNVDNSINFKILKKINSFAKKTFKNEIDIFTCGLGAASEYPQAFLNINRKYEKKLIIEKSLKDIKKYINYLKPKIYFPSGGTYTIYGKYSNLNRYIAQPSFTEIFKTLKNSKTKVYNLIGGNSLMINNSNSYVDKSKFQENKKFKENFILKTKKIKYYYKLKSNLINLKKLDFLFANATDNYKNILKKFNINPNWIINFKIFKNLEISKNCYINKKKSSLLKVYKIGNIKSNHSKIPKLECYLEYDLFYSLLKRKFPWNTSLSGSTIMFKRYPNKFYPDMVYSLNFLGSK